MEIFTYKVGVANYGGLGMRLCMSGSPRLPYIARPCRSPMVRSVALLHMIDQRKKAPASKSSVAKTGPAGPRAMPMIFLLHYIITKKIGIG